MVRTLESSMAAGSRRRRPSCGVFETSRWFGLVFGLLGVTDKLAQMYLALTLVTFEERFGIPSQTSGIIISGQAISQILLTVILAHYGGQGNRPRWIGCGIALSAVCCLVMVLPHLIYGAGQDALALTAEFWDATTALNDSETTDIEALCSTVESQEVCTEVHYPITAVAIAFVAQFGLGIGSCLGITLGNSYMDDNSKKTAMPALYGMVLGLQFVGLMAGYVLAYASLSLFVAPTLTPLVTEEDPRWLGAWWLGWFAIAFADLLLAIVVSMFPKKSPETMARTTDADVANPNEQYPLKASSDEDKMQFQVDESHKSAVKSDLVATVKRLSSNKLMMVLVASGVFHILTQQGIVSFLPKYMQIQFKRQDSLAYLISGVASILATSAGAFTSGVIISKFKVPTSVLLVWAIICGILLVAFNVTASFLDCPVADVGSTNSVMMASTCSAACNCEHMKYAPVCSESRMLTYYSPCHAGCTTRMDADNTWVYGNCSCLLEDIHGTAASGPCPVDCSSSFYWFIVLDIITCFFVSTSKVGSFLLMLRCISPEDKAVAQAIQVMMACVFAWTPGPIIYGAIIDATCTVWSSSCGERGNCSIYDADDFRFYVHGAASVFAVCALVMDITVFCLGRNVQLYDDPPNSKLTSRR